MLIEIYTMLRFIRHLSFKTRCCIKTFRIDDSIRIFFVWIKLNQSATYPPLILIKNNRKIKIGHISI